MIQNPAIVIPCYNRPDSLQNLLNSLLLADYNHLSRVTLIFCADYSGADDVCCVAENFEWPFGEKCIIKHDQNIGLRKNIIFCGDLSQEFGAVIVLEDDIIVSPGFYQYAKAATEFYIEEINIAQISLYAYDRCEVELERFYPLQDGHDSYLARWASSWGQVWTDLQWNGFKEWYIDKTHEDLQSLDIPSKVKRWDDRSWKKYFIGYLVDTEKYVVYPYIGYATNTGVCGEHCCSSGIIQAPMVQAPLAIAAPRQFNFAVFDLCYIRYDSYFQPEKQLVDHLCPELTSYDYEVDFQATKMLKEVKTPYLLSTRHCEIPTKSFAWTLFPLEMNLFVNLKGDKICLAKTSSFNEGIGNIKWAKLVVWSNRLLSTKATIKIGLFRIFDFISYKISKLMSS